MQYVLVTGASGGMGRAVARRMAEQGFCVFALDRVPGEAERQIIPLTVDLTCEQAVQQAAETVRRTTDSLYAILHFAGMYQLDSLVEMTAERFEQIFRVNLLAAFLVNRTFFPFLRKGSRILMTTSELAPLDPLPFTGIYAVSKASLDRYAYALRMELQLRDISVSVLRAGAVQTGMLNASTDALTRFCNTTTLYSCNAERFRRIVDRVEAKCIPPEAIAERVHRILRARHPAFAYAINRNPLLRLLNGLPQRTQMWIIRRLLREPAEK